MQKSESHSKPFGGIRLRKMEKCIKTMIYGVDHVTQEKLYKITIFYFLILVMNLSMCKILSLVKHLCVSSYVRLPTNLKLEMNARKKE